MRLIGSVVLVASVLVQVSSATPALRTANKDFVQKDDKVITEDSFLALNISVIKYILDQIKLDEPTSSLNLLQLILQSTLNGFIAFNLQELKCSDCLTDPSTMQLLVLPKCKRVSNTDEIENWFLHLQSNFDNLQVYQFFLNNYNTSVPEKTRQDLDVVRSVLPSFENLFSYDVYQRTCDYIRNRDIQLDAAPEVLPSKILEDARTYEFLRQFTDFLRCFHGIYAAFFVKYGIAC